MAMPILAPKLFIPPPRREAVPRPELIQRLHEGFLSGSRLTLVCAPAGFGKTTLLSQWIEYSRRQVPGTRVAWVSLDEGDDDPVRFLAHVIAALQGAVAGLTTDAYDPTTPPPVSVEATLTTLINTVAQSPHTVVLVLDDFHLVSGPPIRDAVSFLVDNRPAQLHIVISSRSDPPLPLARMRGGGELTELRAADLRFDSRETAVFLNQVMGLQLSAEHISSLETRTEGWIAGLQLAALSMRGRDDVPGFIEAFTGSNRFVIDYLVEEVLQGLPDHLQLFLNQTAVLDRLSGALCEAVTGQERGWAILEALERDNLFVVPLDDERQWYRYHHLFADVLRARLLTRSPDQAARTHRLASEWYEHHDEPEDSIKHALAARDFDRAAGLIEDALPAMRRMRQDATLLGWLELLPAGIAGSRPVLGVYYAWSLLLAGDLAGAEKRLRDAEAALAAAPDAATGEELRSLPVTIAIYRAALAQAVGDVSGTAEHAGRALALTGADDHFGRGAATAFLALASWADGNPGAALRLLADAETALMIAGNTADALGITVLKADMLVSSGRLREAQHAYIVALQHTPAPGEPISQSAGDLHVGISELYRERDELRLAAEHLVTSQSLGPQASLPESRFRWFVAMAGIRRAEGESDAALDLLAQAERLYVRGFFPDLRPIPAMIARIHIAQGRLAEASAWANQRELSASGAVSFLREFELLTLARLVIAQHRLHPNPTALHDIRGLLDRLVRAAKSEGRIGSVNEILLVQALLEHASGPTSQFMPPLTRMLAQAEPEEYVRLFVDEGAPAAALVADAHRSGITTGYLRRLRGAFQRDAAPAPVSHHPLPDVLSERELHVLRLLETELTGPQIAKELFVSVNTLRTHTKHIFGKLSVNSRTAAVRRAHEQGLI